MMKAKQRGWLSATLMIAAASAGAADFSAITNRYAQAILSEMAAWEISGIAVALVDDQQVVYAAGFGEAKRDSVFRCGSVSKLFTAVGVMQMVEEDKLDLDDPLWDYGPEWLPQNPFTNETQVTLRQILCHRSGFVRETPVGGYFDATEPGVAATVATVSGTVLVNPPNTKTRYSNIGPTVAACVVEKVSGKPFVTFQQERILGPLGMSNSWWSRKDVPEGRLVPAYMRVADGRGGFRKEPAPVFDLGTVPAGNLYTTVGDLARFVSMLADRGKAPGGRVLKTVTLEQMFVPQLIAEPSGFGLGFMVDKWRNRKTISHNGAVYGHSTALVFLPAPRIGVVVMANEDIVNARVQRLANLGLGLMLEVKESEREPGPPAAVAIAREDAVALAGSYESQSYWASIRVAPADTNNPSAPPELIAQFSGQPLKLTPLGPRMLLADSRSHNAVPMVFEGQGRRITGFTMGPQRFRRLPPSKLPARSVEAIPAEWRRLLGSYGPDCIPLIVSVRHGHLYAMTENLFDYRLRPLSRQVFTLPPGLYADELLVFHLGRQQRATAVNLANMYLPRK